MFRFSDGVNNLPDAAEVAADASSGVLPISG
jgi:hypothetical protein